MIVAGIAIDPVNQLPGGAWQLSGSATLVCLAEIARIAASKWFEQ